MKLPCIQLKNSFVLLCIPWVILSCSSFSQTASTSDSQNSSAIPVVMTDSTIEATATRTLTVTPPLTVVDHPQTATQTLPPSTQTTTRAPGIMFGSVEEAIYLLYPFVGYLVVDPRLERFVTVISPASLNAGPGAPVRIGFAHTRKLFWFLDFAEPLSFWISSLEYTEAWQFFPGEEPVERLYWSPDDSLIVIELDPTTNSDFIYSVNSRELIPWPYDCNQIAPSTTGSGYSLWCQRFDNSSDFGVLERGGKIIYTTSPPASVLVHSIPEGNFDLAWSWSPDGTRLAFFDLQSPDHRLKIMDSEGQIIETTLGIGGVDYWQRPHILTSDELIEWSQDGMRILVFTRGSSEHPCPTTIIDAGLFRGTYENPQCWHILDSDTGNVIWRLSDFPFLDGLGKESQDFYEAALSADGRFLSLAVTENAVNALYVIDVESNSIIFQSAIYTGGMKWGPLPLTE